MKLTIKKFKHFNIGHEGGAMTCELYADGGLVAYVENGGHGGPNNYVWVNGKGMKFPAQWGPNADLSGFVATQPERDCCGTMLKPDLDMLVEDAINEWDINRKILAKCKKLLTYALSEDPKDSYRQLNAPYSKELADRLRTKYPTVTIFNETLAV